MNPVILKFPLKYLPFWHIGARMGLGPFVKYLMRIRALGKEKVIDIGSGGGWHSLVAACYGFDVESIDTNPCSIEKLKQTADLMKLHNINVRQASCYSLPFREETFDVAVSSHVIEHLDTPETLLKEVARVLKPGGAFLLMCPSRNHWMRISRWVGVNLDPPDHRVPGFEAADIIKIMPPKLKLSGFSHQARFVESNLMDVTEILSRLFHVRANPVTGKSRTGAGDRRNIAVWPLFAAKEILMGLLVLLCRMENSILFFVKGSAVAFELEKVKEA